MVNTRLTKVTQQLRRHIHMMMQAFTDQLAYFISLLAYLATNFSFRFRRINLRLRDRRQRRAYTRLIVSEFDLTSGTVS